MLKSEKSFPLDYIKESQPSDYLTFKQSFKQVSRSMVEAKQQRRQIFKNMVLQRIIYSRELKKRPKLTNFLNMYRKNKSLKHHILRQIHFIYKQNFKEEEIVLVDTKFEKL